MSRGCAFVGSGILGSLTLNSALKVVFSPHHAPMLLVGQPFVIKQCGPPDTE